MTARLRAPAALFLLLCILSVGVAFAWAKSIYSFQFGDQALFHNFARWINHGEIYIRDFIHFRTPGSYYYLALGQRLFGETFRATSFSILLEPYLFQIAASFALAIAATRALLGRASFAIAVFVAATFLFLTPIFQLRTAIPALALAAYLMTMGGTTPRADRAWSLAAGVLLGLTYWVGQEVFILLAWVIFWVELAARKEPFRERLVRLVWIAGSSFAVLAAGIGALALQGMPVGEYLYYTSIYALFIQPVGMDLPFPPFAIENFVYYIFFLEIALIGALFVLSGVFAEPASIAFMSYAILRMVSALGRSDYLHLVFSISELVVLTPIAIAMIWARRGEVARAIDWRSPRRLAEALVVALAILTLFAAAIWTSSMVLLLAPPLLCLGTWLQGSPAPARDRAASALTNLAAGVIGLGAMVAVFYPNSTAAFRFGTDALFYSVPSRPLIGGVQFRPDQDQELRGVEAFFEEHRPQRIFSYPIRPVYYAFAAEHATRLTYLEPQTTDAEVAGLISDLEIAPADAIVQDVGQMLRARPVLYPLADYIASNYRTVRFNREGRLLELRLLRDEVRPTMRLMDRYRQLAGENRGRVGFRAIDGAGAGAAAGDGEDDARLVLNAKGRISHRLAVADDWVFTTALLECPDCAREADVELMRGENVTRMRLVAGAAADSIPMPAGTGPVTVIFQPSAEGKTAAWIDPRFEGPAR
ncbi:hypothetical protein [Afifella marina]|uniref:4-amino-4-deoxy-L-arabinose transferase n=1 Tax=Afifella marina DSM 2698 TaxID=1120955 RepID=A0A1G5MGU5_AFIMA|nr:hypothetical protein [Afifella marina]MBK1625392.1 hypothetical protein [Afifella marina DSM 2698]MBK1628993.1 hypothetical protein [Afifella marina]MBK5916935.1 hypothetical protein [Afifella marina]RAI22773.1 hypothetical protein CH311_03695 [Afifella marina DSM 2698]SCZ24405.1 4-amino-4-deoxy-L-arabinose transferase [Afifella marina DSM 2698]